MTHIRLLTALGLFTLTACGGDAPPADATPGASAVPDEAAAARTASSELDDQDLPSIMVFKTAGCGCCEGWIEHLRDAGFQVDARDVTNLASVKLDAGVPADLSSCHTALVDGYVVEGHVPADVVKKLLAERPEVAGISVPGMPVGSPGMEGPNPEAYTVEAFTRDGAHRTYAQVDPS
jgi:hypothetical protein